MNANMLMYDHINTMYLFSGPFNFAEGLFRIFGVSAFRVCRMTLLILILAGGTKHEEDTEEKRKSV